MACTSPKSYAYVLVLPFPDGYGTGPIICLECIKLYALISSIQIK